MLGCSRRIACEGPDKALPDVPLALIGDWRSADRHEIEGVRSVQNAMRAYLGARQLSEHQVATHRGGPTLHSRGVIAISPPIMRTVTGCWGPEHVAELEGTRCDADTVGDRRQQVCREAWRVCNRWRALTIAQPPQVKAIRAGTPTRRNPRTRSLGRCHTCVRCRPKLWQSMVRRLGLLPGHLAFWACGS